MKVTVVSLVDNGLVETYVGVVLGTLSEEDRERVASSFGAQYRPGPESDEDLREVSFREVEPAESHLGLHELLNQDDSGMGGVVRGTAR